MNQNQPPKKHNTPLAPKTNKQKNQQRTMQKQTKPINQIKTWGLFQPKNKIIKKNKQMKSKASCFPQCFVIEIWAWKYIHVPVSYGRVGLAGKVVDSRWCLTLDIECDALTPARCCLALQTAMFTSVSLLKEHCPGQLWLPKECRSVLAVLKTYSRRRAAEKCSLLSSSWLFFLHSYLLVQSKGWIRA